MANNYLLFSEMLDLKSKEEFEWVKQEIKGLREEHDKNDNPMLDFEYALEESETEPKKYGLWVYTEEAGEPEKVGVLVQRYLNRFCPDEIFTLTWAATCSKPRIGEFSGGGMVVTAKRIYFSEASDWTAKKVKEIEKRTKRTKRTKRAK